MELVVGKTAGFCYGVKRAVEGTYMKLEEEKNTTFCLGEIIHNADVIKELESKGLKIVDDIKGIKDKVIIRAHGVKKQIYEYAKMKNIDIIDFTCPNVLRIHDICEEFSNKGYYIFLCGSKKHPESIGTISYCGNNSFIIEKKQDLKIGIECFIKSGIKKLLLISQTTYSLDDFKEIEKYLKDFCFSKFEFVVNNTICLATQNRQKETEKISRNVDLMIIIGGKNSSNTKKLFLISQKNCKNCFLIQNKDELDLEVVKKFKKIGIMAGASTPKKSIDEVIELLENLK